MAVYLVLLVFIALIANKINQIDEPGLYESRHGITFTDHTPDVKKLFIFAAIVLLCIAGLRYNVGADYWAYYGSVSARASVLSEKILEYDEPGLSFLFWIATLIKPSDPRALGMFIAAAVTVGTMLYVIYKNTDELALSLVFYVILVWASCFNGVRQSLAAGFLFCGLPYLKERKFVRFLIFVLIASLFHKSALIMIALYFVAGRRASVGNMFIILIGSVVLLYSYDFVFQLLGMVMEDVDQTEYASRSVNILRTMVACAPALLFWISGLYQDEDDPEIAFYLNITLVHAALAIAAAGSSYFARVSMYTDPFMALAIPKLGRKFNEKTESKIMPFLVILYTLFFFYGEYKDETERVFQFIWQR